MLKIQDSNFFNFCSYCFAIATENPWKDRATVRKVKKCGQCHFERYCSRACQKAHWETHKKTCREQETPLSPSIKNLYSIVRRLPVNEATIHLPEEVVMKLISFPSPHSPQDPPIVAITVEKNGKYAGGIQYMHFIRIA